jgi:hypothetical protein
MKIMISVDEILFEEHSNISNELETMKVVYKSNCEGGLIRG